MKRKREPKLTLAQALDKLRYVGYQPLYKKGKLVDWRRVKKGQLQTAEVIVHSSGRVTIQHRSITNGKAERRKDRPADNTSTLPSKVGSASP